ncbi:MAG: permease, partial [Synergistaceae bacterium]|nr:permease [Synergistaceae bacterium]
MNTLMETAKYFVFITSELTLLFVGISTLVALMLMYVPQEKIKRYMSGKGIFGNFVGALIGSLTPFCACSTIPLTLGFLEIGIPFG